MNLNVTKLVVSLFVALAVTSCGSDITGEKKSDEKDKQRELALAEGAVESRYFMNEYYGRSLSEDDQGNLWVNGPINAGTKEEAQDRCQSIAFDLPTIEELSDRIGPTYSFTKEELPVEQVFYTKDYDGEGIMSLMNTVYCIKTKS
ncbi:MAG: hypothetical protein HRU19_16530 [Pseudobacteriovorax sp.]|nr:hypothetical protein [Pseudobacteriovorax sp.]